MKPITRIFGAASLVTGLWAAAAQGQPPPAEISLIQLNEDMYVFNNPGAPGNATALITDEGVVLIDDKFERDYERIVELLGTVTDQPVRYVVNTHYHGDHSGSNVKFQEAGADVIATEAAWARMTEIDQAGRPVFTVEEAGRIHIGGKVVDLLHFGRAHTGGDLVVYFPDYQTLVAGDLFNYGDIPVQLIDYAGGGSAREWTSTLDEIMMLGFETVVPGHGGVTNKAEMRRYRDATVTLRERIRAMVLGGSSRDEIEAVLRGEFGWADLHVARGLDGIMGELR